MQSGVASKPARELEQKMQGTCDVAEFSSDPFSLWPSCFKFDAWGCESKKRCACDWLRRKLRGIYTRDGLESQHGAPVYQKTTCEGSEKALLYSVLISEGALRWCFGPNPRASVCWAFHSGETREGILPSSGWRLASTGELDMDLKLSSSSSALKRKIGGDGARSHGAPRMSCIGDGRSARNTASQQLDADVALGLERLWRCGACSRPLEAVDIDPNSLVCGTCSSSESSGLTVSRDYADLVHDLGCGVYVWRSLPIEDQRKIKHTYDVKGKTQASRVLNKLLQSQPAEKRSKKHSKNKKSAGKKPRCPW